MSSKPHKPRCFSTEQPFGPEDDTEAAGDSAMKQPRVIHIDRNPNCPCCHDLQGPWTTEPSSDVSCIVLDRSWKTWCEVIRNYQCGKCFILMLALQEFPSPGGVTLKSETVVRVRYRRRARNCLEFGFHNLSRETHFHDDGRDASREHTLEIYTDAIRKS